MAIVLVTLCHLKRGVERVEVQTGKGSDALERRP
jgi:hypothetical protein